MRNSLDTFNSGKYSVKMTFSGINELRKAEGNAAKRPNMMKVSKKLANIANNIVFQEIKV